MHKVPTTLFRVAQRLPRSEARWQLLLSEIGGFARAAERWAVVVVEAESGAVRSLRQVDGQVSDAVVLGVLRSAMMTPDGGLRPERPAALQVLDDGEAYWLGKALRLIGVRVEVDAEMASASAALEALFPLGGTAFGAGIEVTISPEVPEWLQRKLATQVEGGAALLEALPPATPWLFAWAPSAEVEAAQATLRTVTGLLAAQEAADPEGDPVRGDDDWVPPPAILAQVGCGQEVLVWDADDVLRADLYRAATDVGVALLVVAERHPHSPPPAMARLLAARRLPLRAIVDDGPLPIAGDGDDEDDDNGGVVLPLDRPRA